MKNMSKQTTISILLSGIFLVLLLLLAAITGWIGQTPDTNSPEAGFARDMSTHHQQAVEMSLLIRNNSDDPEVTTLAYDILNTQATQRGMMSGWLQIWDVPQRQAGPPMQWMQPHATSTESSNNQPMAGMATPAEMDRLAELSGAAAEELFLELMIEHHIGGVEMAEAVLARSDHPVVTRLAQTMVSGQGVEITYMRELLSQY
jgi:uncharacterized protein (DUF305 family)